MPRRAPTPPAPRPLPEPPAVGAALAALREQHALSLDELSRRAGVSKSMLSQIERAQANPTVAVVWRLAHALGVPIGDLLGTPEPAAPSRIELVAAHATPTMGHAESGVSLRILGPIDLAGRFEWYELQIRPGGALVSQPHGPGSYEHLTVQSGTLEVSAGDHAQRVKSGETARYAADQPHAIRNGARTPATALLAVVHGS
ncbi:MAG: helix-turn-helix transcriptional regulator [Rubrivivax sp.]|nr:helix-turn-helix transcriptional regulator [Rubrivivax sp.]